MDVLRTVTLEGQRKCKVSGFEGLEYSGEISLLADLGFTHGFLKGVLEERSYDDKLGLKISGYQSLEEFYLLIFRCFDNC